MKLPTQETYKPLQDAYDFFNKVLFDDQLPNCVLTVRNKRQYFGQYLRKAFISTNGSYSDEIAISPTIFPVHGLLEVLQTVVHEMAHQWQYHFGTPSRAAYHNKEWSGKMEAIGLMPSHNGKPGGKKTGQHMADYPLEGGRFLLAANQLIADGYVVTWFERIVARSAQSISIAEPINLQTLTPEEMLIHGDKPPIEIKKYVRSDNNGTRSKYLHNCQNNKIGFVQMWGKRNIDIHCGFCSIAFEEMSVSDVRHIP